MPTLEIRNLTLYRGEKCILDDFSLTIPTGEMHALMGKNGMGKSSLAKAIAGHPDYAMTKGEIIFDGEDIGQLPPELRAQRGIFLAFQHPIEIPGVSLSNFIRSAMNAQNKKMETVAFYKLLYENMDHLGLNREFSSRAMNMGFSGGEKKRCEVLQILMLRPSFVLLDEIDSGLDIDALKVISESLNALRSESFSGLLITHYPRLFDNITPQKVHILESGKITHSGGLEIVRHLETMGYTFTDHNESSGKEMAKSGGV
ncbi:MAG: Fe-S cluster assembly ATPase SufC [Puniceicoccales bacterium]|jgi:Fe-S cluster assembly ATP-binding protein|nr:Fe-S cluster assembly ATPase SufC [Puniceicoccales bacterium]